jgi:hypothetical protein
LVRRPTFPSQRAAFHVLGRGDRASFIAGYTVFAYRVFRGKVREALYK